MNFNPCCREREREQEREGEEGGRDVRDRDRETLVENKHGVAWKCSNYLKPWLNVERELGRERDDTERGVSCGHVAEIPCVWSVQRGSGRGGWFHPGLGREEVGQEG